MMARPSDDQADQDRGDVEGHGGELILWWLGRQPPAVGEHPAGGEDADQQRDAERNEIER